MFTEFEVQYAFLKSNTAWLKMDLELTNHIASL